MAAGCQPSVEKRLAAGELGQIHELVAGPRQIGAFKVTARAQPGHWAPTAGLRVDDALTLMTDTGYDPGGVPLAQGVAHLLHEAWSPSAAARSAAGDATGRDAGRIAAASNVGQLTLIHLNPLLGDPRTVLEDARAVVPDAQISEDGQALI